MIAAFFVQDFAFAAGEIRPAMPAFRPPVFAASVASVENHFRGSDGRPVVYLVRDAHANESAQRNISSVLQQLASSKKTDLVFLEGGWGDLSLAALAEGVSVSDRRAVAERFLRKGLIQGADYADLVSETPLALAGADDRKLYEEGLELYRGVAQNRERALAWLDLAGRLHRFLKSRLYSSELQKLDALRSAYRNDGNSFFEYLEALIGAAAPSGIGLETSPAVEKAAALRVRETALDFSAAAREQAEAVQSLDSSVREALLEAAREKKREAFFFGAPGHEADGGFFARLGEALGPRLSNYPALAAYLDYLRAARGLNAEELLVQTDVLEAAVFSAMARTEDERELVRAEKTIDVLRDLFSLKLESGKWELVRRDPAAFDPTELAARLNSKVLDLGTRHEFSLFLDEAVSAAYGTARRFYENAAARDERFVETLLSGIAARGAKSAVFVAGGFHTGHVEELLAARGVSFVSVRPQVLSETNGKKYESLLLERSTIALQPAALMRNGQVRVQLAEAFDALRPSGARLAANPGALKVPLTYEAFDRLLHKTLALKKAERRGGPRVLDDGIVEGGMAAHYAVRLVVSSGTTARPFGPGDAKPPQLEVRFSLPARDRGDAEAFSLAMRRLGAFKVLFQSRFGDYYVSKFHDRSNGEFGFFALSYGARLAETGEALDENLLKIRTALETGLQGRLKEKSGEAFESFRAALAYLKDSSLEERALSPRRIDETTASFSSLVSRTGKTQELVFALVEIGSQLSLDNEADWAEAYLAVGLKLTEKKPEAVTPDLRLKLQVEYASTLLRIGAYEEAIIAVDTAKAESIDLQLALATGKKPKIKVGDSAWRALKDHPNTSSFLSTIEKEALYWKGQAESALGRHFEAYDTFREAYEDKLLGDERTGYAAVLAADAAYKVAENETDAGRKLKPLDYSRKMARLAIPHLEKAGRKDEAYYALIRAGLASGRFEMLQDNADDAYGETFRILAAVLNELTGSVFDADRFEAQLSADRLKELKPVLESALRDSWLELLTMHFETALRTGRGDRARVLSRLLRAIEPGIDIEPLAREFERLEADEKVDKSFNIRLGRDRLGRGMLELFRPWTPKQRSEYAWESNKQIIRTRRGLLQNQFLGKPVPAAGRAVQFAVAREASAIADAAGFRPLETARRLYEALLDFEQLKTSVAVGTGPEKLELEEGLGRFKGMLDGLPSVTEKVRRIYADRSLTNAAALEKIHEAVSGARLSDRSDGRAEAALHHSLLPEKQGGLPASETGRREAAWNRLLDRQNSVLVRGVFDYRASRRLFGRQFGAFKSYLGTPFEAEFVNERPVRIFFHKDKTAREFFPISDRDTGRIRGTHTGHILHGRFSKLKNAVVETRLDAKGSLFLGGGRPGISGKAFTGVRESGKENEGRIWGRFGKGHAYERVRVFVRGGLVVRVISLESGLDAKFSAVYDRIQEKWTTSFWWTLPRSETRLLDSRHEILLYPSDARGGIKFGSENNATWMSFGSAAHMPSAAVRIFDIRNRGAGRPRMFAAAAAVVEGDELSGLSWEGIVVWHPERIAELRRNVLVYAVPHGVTLKEAVRFSPKNEWLAASLRHQLFQADLQTADGKPVTNYFATGVSLGRNGSLHAAGYWGIVNYLPLTTGGTVQMRRGKVDVLQYGSRRFVRVVADGQGRLVIDAATGRPPVLEFSKKNGLPGERRNWPAVRLQEPATASDGAPADAYRLDPPNLQGWQRRFLEERKRSPGIRWRWARGRLMHADGRLLQSGQVLYGHSMGPLRVEKVSIDPIFGPRLSVRSDASSVPFDLMGPVVDYLTPEKPEGFVPRDWAAEEKARAHLPDGARLADFFGALSTVVSLPGKTLPLRLDQKTALFSFRSEAGEVVATAAGIGEIRIPRKTAPVSGEKPEDSLTVSGLRSLEDSIHLKLDAVIPADLSKKPVIVEIDAAFLEDASASAAADLVVALALLLKSPEGENLAFEAAGAQAKTLSSLDSTGRVFSASRSAELAASGAVRVRWALPEMRAASVLNVPMSALSRGDVVSFRAAARLAAATGRIDRQAPPDWYLDAWGVLSGSRPDRALLASILDGTAPVERALAFALKPLARVSDFLAEQYSRLRLRMASAYSA